MSDSRTKHTWRGFLRGQGTPEARILLAVGGKTPRDTRNMLETQFKFDTIPRESFEYRMVIWNELVDVFMDRGDIDVRDPGDWVPLNDDGARMRPMHLNSEGSGGYD